jgi:hypothetical protein
MDPPTSLSTFASPVLIREILCIRLAELSKEAHAAAARGDAQGLRAIEAEIDQQAAEVWGLSAEELRAVQESLMELSGEVEAVVLEE